MLRLIVYGPGQGRGLVGAGKAGPVHIEFGVSTLEDDDLLALGAGSIEPERFLVELCRLSEIFY